MRQPVNSQWKVLLAVLSLLLTVLIWQRGLQDSVDRPSVSPKLSVNQQEIAYLAAPALPKQLAEVLIGNRPDHILKDTLLNIPSEILEDREKLVLALIRKQRIQESYLSSIDLKDNKYQLIQKKLMNILKEGTSNEEKAKQLDFLKVDPLLFRTSCLSIDGDSELCVDPAISKSMAFRLIWSQLMPFFATLVGIGLCLQQGWFYFWKRSFVWPKISPLPLKAIDMVLLVAGGFVVLGEVISPLILLPISRFLTSSISSPIKESLNVLFGYIAMTLPPLIIFRQQFQVVQSLTSPIGGWMQWGVRPMNKSIFAGVRGWLMILPFVLCISWVMSLLVGDPGGSNPLLEMVLESKNFLALAILFCTTVFLAPLFEEFIFRGVLLPVLARDQGKILGVLISALVFAVAHLSIGELPPLFVLGIGLAVLRLSSGRLFPCVIMHSLWNGITFASLLLLSP